MDIQNVSGDFLALTGIGIELVAGETKTGIADKWAEDADIVSLVNGGKLVLSNYDTNLGSAVVAPEVAAAVADAHTHANMTEIDKVTVGDHDVIVTGNPHAVDAAQAGADVAGAAAAAQSAAEAASDPVGSASTVQGNLDTHTGTVTGNPHVVTLAEVGADAAGAAATVQGNLDTHTGTVTGNPHAVALSDLAYTAGTAGDWAGSAPTDVAAALDRIAAQVAINAGVPIP